jgi:2-succinyl-5-enolpyruvyl-6-hydroxy-3-cyclohexene-1-carboxylate synthase
MNLRAENLNMLWAGLLVEELARCGVEVFCVAPGSRSSPLALAVAENPRVESVVHFDERGLGYYALGRARGMDAPVAVITTSGTAAVNLMPAVVEASLDHVPMIVLTADRPPELRDTQANQTIDQVHLFGSYPKWFFDMPCPDPRIDPAMVLTTADHAVHRARGFGGPVHINCMFREPLAPVRDGSVTARTTRSLRTWAAGDRPFTAWEEVKSATTLLPTGLGEQLARARRVTLVAGALGDHGDATAVGALAERQSWPVFPDVRSGLRFGPRLPGVVAHADLMLLAERFTARHRPDLVIHVGGRITSKRIAEFIARSGAPIVSVSPYPERSDSAHKASRRIVGSVRSFCEAVEEELSPSGSHAWVDAWSKAHDAAASALAKAQKAAKTLTEPMLARIVTQLLPPQHGLFAGNSMPVRDVDMFGEARAERVEVTANRGASGIDGNLATAAGWADGRGRPATILLGDLSLLHDLNSLALLRDSRQPVTVIAVNNDGGGIFSFLPVAAAGASFEKYFGTPHGLTFESLARGFGLAYARPSSMAMFAKAYKAAAASGSSSVIEVRTDRARSVADHRAVQLAVVRAVERTAGR